MSWTSDVASSLEALDLAPRRLRRFGLTVGAALLALSSWVAFRGRAPIFRDASALGGLALLVAGAAFPDRLRLAYRSWMALAFALGWVMSRVALTALFALVVTPIAVLARLAGKRFLEVPPDRSASTYWVRRDTSRPARYDKMY